MADWFEETLHAGFRTRLEVGKVLYEGDSEHQKLLLFENPVFGRVLALNDIVQTTERDEFIYHEMLSHLPLFAHGAARRVLIIGGGDGGMLEEVLKHRTVEKVTMVEIDAAVVEFSKEHLGFICGDAFDDPRLDLVIADGIAFVESTEERFDVMIVDSTDPVGPGEVLFTDRFYTAAKRCLAPGGVLVTQNGVPFFQGDELTQTIACLRPLFRDTSCYLAAVPGYTGGVMAFGWATDDEALRQTPLDRLRERHGASGIATRHYTPEVHIGAFALPPWVADLMT
ncbi:MAG: polyamine aminopropyltransferase [Alphaproteobacteria bacterium]|nr:polyamine aminopropyltransferase [Alphaproteobacteria bacterium]